MRRALLLALTAILAVIGWLVYVKAIGPRVATATAARREIVQRVVVSGRVMPLSKINLAVLSPGTVASVHVIEGQSVKAGEPLLRLDDAEARASLAAAKAQLDAASARLESQQKIAGPVALEVHRQADANLLAAQVAYERKLALLKTGAATQQEVDDAKRAFDVAKSSADATHLQVKGALGAEQRLAFASFSQATAAVATAQVRFEQTKLAAPADALVLARNVEPGDVVQPGRVLLLLAKKGETLLSISPDEKTLGSLRLGLVADVAADAFPDKPFKAEIVFIAPAIDPARGTVEVRLRVPTPPEFLRAEMTVSVDIETGRRPAALVVPNEALHDVATSPWVVALSAEHTVRRDVKLGLRGVGMTEILQGVGEGDLLVLPGTAPVALGRKVRP